MKNKDLNRLAHFMLQQLTISFAKQMEIKDEVDSDSKIKKSDKRELYSEIIEAQLNTQRTVAKVMATAQKSDSYTFSNKDFYNKSIGDVAKDLGIELPECKACKKENSETMPDKLKKAITKKFGKSGAEIKEVELPPEVAEKLGELFEKLAKRAK